MAHVMSAKAEAQGLSHKYPAGRCSLCLEGKRLLRRAPATESTASRAMRHDGRSRLVGTRSVLFRKHGFETVLSGPQHNRRSLPFVTWALLNVEASG